MNNNSIRWRQHFLLLVLTLFYVETFIGRQIMAVMIEPIKVEFAASDSQMGLLTGLAFAIVFALTGLSAGRLADRVNRTNLLAASALCWCILTAISGMATGLIFLIIMRMLVAVAESPVTSSSLSLLADSYPLEQRSFAISCFTSGATFSAVIAMTIGAHWVEEYGWRHTLFIISLPAAFLSCIFLFVLRDPRVIDRRSSQKNAANVDDFKEQIEGFREATKKLLKLKEYRMLVVASAIATIGANAFGMWNTTFLVRSHELSLTQAGLMAGIFGGGSAAIGILLSGYLANRITKSKGILWLPLVGHSLGWICLIIYLLWPIGFGDEWLSLNIPFAMIFCAMASFFSVWWFSPSITLLTEIVPNNQRALAISMQTVLITLFGVGLGPILVGILSDSLNSSFGNESLRYALITISCSTLISILILMRLKAYRNKQQLEAEYSV